MTILEEIAAERQKRIYKGYTLKHDQEDGQDLAIAATCYAWPPNIRSADGKPPGTWPWERGAWKPEGEREDLIKAAALIVARIEVLDEMDRDLEFHSKVTNNLKGMGPYKLQVPREEHIGQKVCDSKAQIYTLVGVKENLVAVTEDGIFQCFLKGKLYRVPLAWLGNDALYDGSVIWNMIVGSYHTLKDNQGRVHVYSQGSLDCSLPAGVFLPTEFWSHPNE